MSEAKKTNKLYKLLNNTAHKRRIIQTLENTIIKEDKLENEDKDDNPKSFLGILKNYEDEKTYKEKENLFFVTSYDPFAKEIYFFSFDKEKIIRKHGHIGQQLEEKINTRVEEFNKNWERIKTLSYLEDETFLSSRSLIYFKRPFSSKFLHPEVLGVNHFTSTYPLPAAFQAYREISIEIVIHKTVFDIESSELKEKLVINRKVGFYYT
jgi:hypothetical protein